MAFVGEKLGAMFQRPQDENRDDVPWYMRYGARALGTVGGGFAILLGIWNCLGIMLADVGCLFGGTFQVIAGIVAIAIEAPCCCMFIEHIQTLSNFMENRPYWNRAALYCGIAIPGILFCFGLGSLFGSGLIFATGVMYGMMGLGKKASRDEMRAAAASSANAAPTTAPPSSTMKADLVSNAQPMSNSSAPFPGV
ncbi:Hypothetical predicted protein [Cloeon dipterum]|uniref:Calcium channel flower n=2 Tax=Cloeon dipterum TaxID=197152 RepID=A0A8S1CKM9_9INSE|nr:Hypothetical predicted protein [Cloeon dipterum]